MFYLRTDAMCFKDIKFKVFLIHLAKHPSKFDTSRVWRYQRGNHNP